MKLEGYVERADLLTVLLGALGNQALKPDARIEGLLEALRAQKLRAADWPGLLLALTTSAIGWRLSNWSPN